jgi:hypothetical protein
MILSVYVVCLLIFLIIMLFQTNETEKITNKFIKAVESNDPEKVSKLFCSNGILIGTVSQVERKNEDIRLYFDYFAKLPNIRVLSKQYSITDIEPDVHVNNAIITWTWDGLKSPIIARMTFVIKDNCIFELHSSALPEENEKLHKISNKF